jgi:hypothetical protein
VVSKNLEKVLEQVPPLRAVEALLGTSFGERLAGRTRTQDIMSRNSLNRYLSNVPVRAQAEVPLIEFLEAIV